MGTLDDEPPVTVQVGPRDHDQPACSISAVRMVSARVAEGTQVRGAQQVHLVAFVGRAST